MGEVIEDVDESDRQSVCSCQEQVDGFRLGVERWERGFCCVGGLNERREISVHCSIFQLFHHPA